MDVIHLLRLIKFKIFAPKKKFVFDSDGVRHLTDSKKNSNDKNLNSEDSDLLEEIDGWNLADREYVDFKISELYTRIQQAPSAPPLEAVNQTTSAFSSLLSGKNSGSSSNQVKCMFSPGIISEDKITFFDPGMVFKKGSVMTEFTLFVGVSFDEELILSVRNVIDDRTVQISKIKTTGKNIISAESKYKTDVHKVLVFELKSSGKPLTFSSSLQICVV